MPVVQRTGRAVRPQLRPGHAGARCDDQRDRTHLEHGTGTGSGNLVARKGIQVKDGGVHAGQEQVERPGRVITPEEVIFPYQLLTRIGHVDLNALTESVQRDAVIAKKMKTP